MLPKGYSIKSPSIRTSNEARGIYYSDNSVKTNLQVVVQTLTDTINSGIIDVQGLRGPQGDAGVRGPQGSVGVQGNVGPQGDAGVRGPQGSVGVQGNVGPQGDAGVRGPQGSVGVQGNVGPQGAQGDAGVRGPQGSVGVQGAQGAQGDAGVRGPQGSVGVQGNAGVQGDAGVRGPQGSVGVQGNAGVQGDAGVRGPQGSVGPVGSGGYAFSYDTTSQGVDVAGEFQDVNFDTNAELSDWTHQHSTSSFTCGMSGMYYVSFRLEITCNNTLLRLLSVTTTARATVNDFEIPGSGIARTNNIEVLSEETSPMSTSFIANFAKNDILRIQFTSNNNASEIRPVGDSSTKPSASITIFRIA